MLANFVSNGGQEIQRSREVYLSPSGCNGRDMAEVSSDTKENVDIKPIVNSQDNENQASLITGDLNGTTQPSINMKQEPKPVSKDLTLTVSANTPASQNGTDVASGSLTDLTRPLKTEGEASTDSNSLNTTALPPRTSQAGTPTGNLTPDSHASFTTFGNISNLGSHLTPEDQAATYRKANILALSALAKNGGPNAKEMLAVQQKLQEFLTSLISLAGQKGPDLKVKVQQLVQNLVTGQVGEDEFANQIEKDLQSQHQPSLLPFLKNSVPHLKTRLQLQQAIMKELLQRQEREKSAPTPSTSSQTPPTQSKEYAPAPTPSTTTSQPTVTTQFPAGSTVSKPIVIGAGLQVKNSTNTTQTVQVQATQLSVAPPSTASSAGGSLSTNQAGATLSTGGIVLQPALIEQLSSQLPKNVRDQIAKLPPDQQKMVYLHHFKRLQAIRQQLLSKQKPGPGMPPSSVSSEQIVRSHQQLIKEQQASLTAANRTPGSKGPNSSMVPKTSFSNMKLVSASTSANSLTGTSPSKGKKSKGKGKDVSMDANEEEEDGMDILDEVGVNLQEESAQFLPQTEGTAGSVKDQTFLDLGLLRRRASMMARQHGIGEVSEEYVSLLSHATEARLRDILEKLTQISQHRTEVLKDNSEYRVQSEVRGQLRVLETIDRMIDKRKTERENEQTLKAAKSRSKGADPVKAAEIRDQARQIQEDKAAIMRDQAANETALKAIGSRKRPSPQSDGAGSSSGGPSSSQTGATSSLFAPLNMSRAPKRHVTSRDLIFYLEQERETRKSQTLYKTLMK